jgi:hypothetical protein
LKQGISSRYCRTRSGVGRKTLGRVMSGDEQAGLVIKTVTWLA